MKALLIVLCLAIWIDVQAQVAINTDGSLPHSSSMLDVKSTSKGLLAPRMTLAQRSAIITPATGLTIFQTDGIPGLYYNSGTPGIPVWALVGSNAGQWLNNGTSIYYNLGKVGVGTSSPVANFHVAENSPGITGAFGRPIYNWNSSTNVSIGDDDGPAVMYIGQSESNSGLLSWQYNSTPANAYFNIATYAGSNPLVLQGDGASGGKVGIGTTSPSALLHVANISSTNTGLFGTPISTYTAGTNVSIGDDVNNSLLYIGQSPENKGFLIWNQNATPSDAYFSIGTYSGYNPLILQGAGGNVGIGTTTPASLLDIQYDENTSVYLGQNSYYNSYFYHNELEANGDGQTALYALRTRLSINNGTGYGIYTSNTAIKGYAYWGDLYSFGTAGFNYNDDVRSGGILGANQGAEYWGSLGYKNSAGTGYGGYFSSYTGGSGKSNQAETGIGIGAWGDLLGADIHGRVYGIYAEGENYAMFQNGPVFKNNLDVHLQDNGTGDNTVLYTHVSTDVTIQTSGYATLSSGKASIEFDPAFTASVSSEIPVVVTVTPTGNSNGVYLAAVSKSGFSVVENNNGKSNVTVSYIAIGKRTGYEHPRLPKEVIDAGYVSTMARGLHNDADTKTNGEGLYYENGQLVVGIHPSTLPDPNKPEEETVIPKSTTPPKMGTENKYSATGIGEPEQVLKQTPAPDKNSQVASPAGGAQKIQPVQPPKSRIENGADSPAKSK